MNGLLHHLAISLKLNFRSKQAIIYGYVVPIFFLIAFGSVFATKPALRAEMGQLITVTILGGACFGMPTTMVAERERGVWRRFRLLPAATGGIILSAMVARFFIVLSAALMQILLAHFFYKTPWPQHPWGMMGAFAFVCFAFLGLGLVIAMVADNVPAVQALGQAIFLPMIMIGGVGVPLEKLPVWVQHVAAFLPGRYAVDALEACQFGAGLAVAKFNLISLTVIGLAAILAGAKLFRWDIAQKIAGPAKGWVAVAVVGWVSVGLAAELPAWREHLKVKRSRVSTASIIAPSSIPSVPKASPATHPTTELGVVITPPPARKKQPWEQVTQAQMDSIDYDDLPDDNSTNTPLAPDLDNVDDDTKKRMDNFMDALGDWPAGQVEDIAQRLRYLLSICAVADVAEDQNEAQIPYVVFKYIRGTIQKDQLAKALTWVILHDTEGTVLTNIKEIKELAIDAEVPEDTVRDRARLYAKKLLFRVLGKKPAG